jgi:hypothetical protein
MSRGREATVGSIGWLGELTSMRGSLSYLPTCSQMEAKDDNMKHSYAETATASENMR